MAVTGNKLHIENSDGTIKHVLNTYASLEDIPGRVGYPIKSGGNIVYVAATNDADHINVTNAKFGDSSGEYYLIESVPINIGIYDNVSKAWFYPTVNPDNLKRGSDEYGKYVESVGDTYIDTGITMDQNCRIEIEHRVSENSLIQEGGKNAGNYFGVSVWSGPGAGRFTSGQQFERVSSFGIAEQDIQYIFANRQVNLPLTQVHNTYSMDKNGGYLNGNLVATFDDYADFDTSPYTLYLFAQHEYRPAESEPWPRPEQDGYSGGKSKIYWCKVYKNNSLVRYFTPEPVLAEYTITVTQPINGWIAINGNIGDSFTFATDSLITVTMGTDTGYDAVSLAMDDLTVASGYSFNLVKNVSISGTVKIKTFTISVTQPANGDIYINGSTGTMFTFDYNTMITVTMSAHTGYTPSVLYVNGVSVSNGNSFAITNNSVVSGAVAINYYTVTVDQPEGGYITINGSRGISFTYAYETQVTIVAVADSGYIFSSLIVDGVSCSNPYTFTVASNSSASAVMSKSIIAGETTFTTSVQNSTTNFTVPAGVTIVRMGAYTYWGNGTYWRYTCVKVTPEKTYSIKYHVYNTQAPGSAGGYFTHYVWINEANSVEWGHVTLPGIYQPMQQLRWDWSSEINNMEPNVIDL